MSGFSCIPDTRHCHVMGKEVEIKTVGRKLNRFASDRAQLRASWLSALILFGTFSGLAFHQERDLALSAPARQDSSKDMPPAPPSENPSKIPDERTWPQFLEATRAKAIAYTDDLPNFICTQITTRFERIFPKGWHQVDNFVADLTYFEKKENYRIISVSNQATATATIENLSGARSTGEFGSALRMLFDPDSNATFRLEGVDLINGHETMRVSYQVPQETSRRAINYNNQKTIVTAYRGRCWIDPASFNVVRLEDRAFNIPQGFPVKRSEGSIDYDLQDIAGHKYWLPVHAEMMMAQGDGGFYTRNVIEFKKYRKFEAEVRIVPE